MVFLLYIIPQTALQPYRRSFQERIYESSQRDLLTKYLFDGGREWGYHPGKYLSVRSIGVSWKMICVRGLDRASFIEEAFMNVSRNLGGSKLLKVLLVGFESTKLLTISIL